MKIETFVLERTQSVWENTVRYNLTETGIHPFKLNELFNKDEIDELLSTRLGYGQSNGSIPLRQSICQLYRGAEIENVLVTNGSSEANFIAMWTLLDADDEIVLMLPNYMQIWGIARAFGAKVKPFYLKEEREWAIDLDELKSLVTTKTKMIVLCNPNNPTGTVLSQESIQEIIGLAQNVDAWIYVDEVYQGAELNGVETESFFGLYDKVIVCCGLSKAYALPGLRLGWLVGPPETIERCWASRDYTSISPGILSDKIATKVLQPGMRQQIFGRNRKMLRENLSSLQQWVKGHDNRFVFVTPQAGGLTFLRYDMDINSTELTTQLREQKSVFIVAGDCFGMDHYLRIGIGVKNDYLKAGLNLFDEFLQETQLI